MPVPFHCPACGSRVRETGPSTGRCDACPRDVFANSRPTAGVLLERDGRVLLVRRGVEPARGRWDVPGGFLLEGERPEDGARREIREELGWDIGELHPVLTEVNPVSDGAVLDVIFEAVAPDTEPRPASDVAGCAWFDPDELPEDLAFDATRRILDGWWTRRRALRPRLLDGTVLHLDELPVVSRFEAPLRDLPHGWSVESGAWRTHDGMPCGSIEGDRPAVLWCDADVEGDHLIAFRAYTVPPCANDVNCYWEGSGRIAHGDDEAEGVACTVGGVGGWWDGLTGIERYPEGGLRATARLTPLVAGRTIEIVAGRRGDADFLFVDGRLAMQVDDPGAVRRDRSRVALATWDGHVHVIAASVHRIPPDLGGGGSRART